MARHVNSEWGSGLPIKAPMPLPSAFEIEAKRLGLTPDTYASSVQLRTWCERNSNRSYIPEWLLKEWRIHVDPYLA